ncbi:molybdopterin molybdotransferase MoeA [Pedobacter sp. MW01-1-1]|uniref:molybdopterin molybdotransferase MoeA n=1 Tax=Pedobacter sp. MW01-1-1 TaxID=3383027 RepID=UPI003FF13D5B
MISVEEAKKLISENTEPLKAETLPLEKLLGHVLAQDIIAPIDIPAYKQSAMDGYAFAFEPLVKELTLVGEMAAGTDKNISLAPGESSRIFTGAPLPTGADTVIMQEHVQVVDNKIILNNPKLEKTSNVRPIGSEVSAGALAMQKGDLISPAALGFLAGIGITNALVYPFPKIGIILTGNELQAPGEELSFGKVYESNSYALKGALQKEGITQITCYWAMDSLQEITDTLQNALSKNDVILLTGGVSVGDYDFVLKAAENCSIHKVFHKVKQKPGKPLFFGTKNKQLIFGLPGNPSSVLSCFYNYVLPALKSISHQSNSTKILKATLQKNLKKAAGLTHFLKGFYQNGMVIPLDAQESYKLSSFAVANCLLILPQEQENAQQGDTIDILLLPE